MVSVQPQTVYMMLNCDFNLPFPIDGLFHIRHEKSLTNMIRIFLPDIIDKICWKHDVSL